MNDNLVKVLNDGGIAVMPTDTIYGLVTRALDPVAVEKLYTLRRRSPEKPCIILIAEVSDLEKFGIRLGWFGRWWRARRMLRTLWPGPVSIVFSCDLEKFAYLHRNTNALAFRLPDDKGLRHLLRHTGPLIAPSANPEGLAPAATAAEAKKYFGDAVDYYEDAGTKTGLPSTLVDISTGAVRILRQGSATIPEQLL